MSLLVTRPRLGFVGVGWIGRMRLDALVASGAADVAGIVDPALPGSCGSLEDLLELGVDGIVIATPNALHAPAALGALEQGVAVFCQKPLAPTAAEARAVVEAARSADRLLGVDLSYRHTRAVRAVYELVASGGLGSIFAVELAFHNAYGPDKAWFRDPGLAGGGCLLDLGVHVLDLALGALGYPAVTNLESALHGRPLEHYAAVQLELATGATVQLACSWHLHAGRDCVFEVRFYGTNGGATVRNVGGSFYDFVAERHEGTHTEVLVEPPDEWGGRAAVEWARRLGAGEAFDDAAEDYVRLHEVVDRIYGRAG